ncbi:MAG: sigma-70 family RNA polymerase sigma factor [Bacteroidota bacterium]|nr:sigma-70 family RNA polymerase sigma factor [Bacteroidota bacterium]MDP4232964.1 sigma-70 family RNA polymerase sigma factor [Bacteroidota bacterium]MDP4242008.1 sigma-70 family RNA polymerase sigma factor [Bacteroidota bacterium]MDP4286911.1 sigma-70 family RNA polymerase sigma factor [Bacteroidota bacterium]
MPYWPEHTSMTDEELVRLCQRSVAERDSAFTALVVRYQKRIYLAARKMVRGDHDEADEIAQETFVKAYQALASFRGDSQFYTWLYRIMMNGVIQRSRRKSIREFVRIDDMDSAPPSEDIAPDQGLIGSETTRLLEEAIELLPPKQRRVFLMRFYDELPYEEIAKIVGTSVGGLKANYFHAVRKIGEHLKASGQIRPEFLAEAPSD